MNKMDQDMMLANTNIYNSDKHLYSANNLLLHRNNTNINDQLIKNIATEKELSEIASAYGLHKNHEIVLEAARKTHLLESIMDCGDPQQLQQQSSRREYHQLSSKQYAHLKHERKPEEGEYADADDEDDDGPTNLTTLTSVSRPSNIGSSRSNTTSVLNMNPNASTSVLNMSNTTSIQSTSNMVNPLLTPTKVVIKQEKIDPLDNRPIRKVTRAELEEEMRKKEKEREERKQARLRKEIEREEKREKEEQMRRQYLLHKGLDFKDFPLIKKEKKEVVSPPAAPKIIPPPDEEASTSSNNTSTVLQPATVIKDDDKYYDGNFIEPAKEPLREWNMTTDGDSVFYFNYYGSNCHEPPRKTLHQLELEKTLPTENVDFFSALHFLSSIGIGSYNSSHIKIERKPRNSYPPPKVELSGICNICGANYPKNDVAALQKHIYDYHIDVNSTNCVLCHKPYTDKKTLNRHMLNYHMNYKPYKCDSCDKSFSRRDHLTRHETRHNANRQTFPCHTCQKSFTRKEHLKKHMLTHDKNSATYKPMKCNICKKTFDRMDRLKEHKARHTKSKKKEKAKKAKARAKKEKARAKRAKAKAKAKAAAAAKAKAKEEAKKAKQRGTRWSMRIYSSEESDEEKRKKKIKREEGDQEKIENDPNNVAEGENEATKEGDNGNAGEGGEQENKGEGGEVETKNEEEAETPIIIKKGRKPKPKKEVVSEVESLDELDFESSGSIISSIESDTPTSSEESSSEDDSSEESSGSDRTSASGSEDGSGSESGED